jgi:hypothetical protein
MPDLVDRIRKEFDARIRELRPVVREFERLERATAALARAGARSASGLRSRVGATAKAPTTGRAAGRRPAGLSTTRAAAPGAAKPRRRATARRKPAPRGQTRAKVLDALVHAPGSSPAAVATASGISPNVAAATISRLVKQGRVRRLEDGGYAVVEASAGPPEAAPAAASAQGPAEQPKAVEGRAEPPTSPTAE